jgi:hypothetical protein
MDSQTQANNADAASIALYLGGAGAALWALVLALEPDVGFVAPFPWMALFWALQIGAGLAALQCVLFLITRLERSRQLPLWVVVIASGVIGSAFLSPLYWLIGEGLMEQVLGFPARVDNQSDIDSGLSFGLSAVVNEFGDIVGPVTAAWALISWPRLQRLVPPLLNLSQTTINESMTPAIPFPEQRGFYVKPAWRTTLPRELGEELIAVSSELQYLRVWTTRGSALVLGSLQQVEETEASDGIRTHRSWWVNVQHVARVRGKGDGAVCELSNGLEVPVSRRRKADVMARFGSSASYRAQAKAAVSPISENDQNIRRRPT